MNEYFSGYRDAISDIEKMALRMPAKWEIADKLRYVLMYHGTPKAAVKKILKHGILPARKGFQKTKKIKDIGVTFVAPNVHMARTYGRGGRTFQIAMPKIEFMRKFKSGHPEAMAGITHEYRTRLPIDTRSKTFNKMLAREIRRNPSVIGRLSKLFVTKKPRLKRYEQLLPIPWMRDVETMIKTVGL